MGRGVERLAKYYKGIGVKNVSVHLIEGSRHEFLNEAAHREEGLAAIAEFIKRISEPCRRLRRSAGVKYHKSYSAAHGSVNMPESIS